MKGIPNRQKKNVLPKRDYVRAKRELLRREILRKGKKKAGAKRA